uniref:Uncharacterized protein LOC105120926 isoform X1 n=1 Tax=Rhizophora mucronata TaxID=61149 RepID=A0A2P2QBJ3_RHIMU
MADGEEDGRWGFRRKDVWSAIRAVAE